MNRSRHISRLIVLSTAVVLTACGGGDPEPAGSSGGPVASGSGAPPCPVPEVNGLCPTPGTGGGTPSTPPPPPPPPTTPPTTPPVVTSDPCLIPVPGFSGSYRNSAKPDLQIHIATTGSASAPVETTTFAADGIRVESTNHLKVTFTASGGPQLEWNTIRTEFTSPIQYSLQEYSVGQKLNLPMRPGDSQTTGGAVSGTQTLVTLPGTSCSGAVSGSQVVTYTYAGIDPVTVPAGSFAACRFTVTKVSDIKTTCDDGHGSGQATDTTALWVLDGHIIKSVGADGSVLELTSYTE
jgi:hypothetical protein